MKHFSSLKYWESSKTVHRKNELYRLKFML